MTRTNATRTARAPGRVNLIGEHTDHVGGLVLPMAIDRAVRIRFTAREDGLVAMRSASRPGVEDRFDPRNAPPPAPGDWRSYARGVAALLSEEGLVRRGIDAFVEASLPEGAGLSSSAALEVAVALALLDVSGASMPPLRLASLCREAESRWAGVSCGIMDQIAALLGRADAALRIDCTSVDVTPIAFPPMEIVVVDTGVRRTLASTPYNDRVREFRTAIGASPATPLSAMLRRRSRHALGESDRVDRAATALAQGDLATLGRLLDASHASLRDDAEVSWPEADREVERARHAGALGARMLGGGFGGSILALFAPGTEADYACRPGAMRLCAARGASIERD